MKNKEYREAEIAQEIISEINEGKPDCPHLKTYIHKNAQQMETLIERLNDEKRSTQFSEQYGAFNPHDRIQHFQSNLKEAKRLKRRQIVLKISASLSAAVILLSFAIFSYGPSKEESKTMIVNETPQRARGPILITQDSVIELVADNSKIIASNYSTSANNSIGNAKSNQQRLIIPNENTYTILLADGTEVMLNAGSELSYPSNFNDAQNREVTLKGEAFFKVAKEKKPFIVKTSNGAYVRVYGTQFNLDAKNLEEVTTILIEGSVGFGSINGREVKIKPNQMIVWHSSNNHNDVSDINPTDHLSWTRGLFEYTNGNFNTVIDEISSWYGVKFHYNKALFENYKLTLSIDRNLEMKDLLLILEDITGTENIQFIKGGQNEYNIIK